MQWQRSLKIILYVNLTAAVATAATAAYLQQTSTLQLTDIGTIVAALIAALGALMSGGLLGGTSVEEQLSISASQNPQETRNAFFNDKQSSISAAMHLIVGALLWLAIVYSGYKLFA